MTLDEFVCRAQRAYPTPMSLAVYAEDSWAVWGTGVRLWNQINSTITDLYFNRATHIAVLWPDGSAQLLSRNEAECRLFTTLWELGK